MPSPFQTRQIARQIGGPTYNPTNITATKVLTSSDDNQIWNVTQSGSGAFTISLPKLATITAGWNATFHVQVAAANHATILVNDADDNKMFGSVVDVGSAGDIVESADGMRFVGGTAKITDRIYCEYDGLNWYVASRSGVDGGVVKFND